MGRISLSGRASRLRLSRDLAGGRLHGVLANNAETHCLVVKLSLHGLVHGDRDKAGAPAVDGFRDIAVVVARYLHALHSQMPRWRIYLRGQIGSVDK